MKLNKYFRNYESYKLKLWQAFNPITEVAIAEDFGFCFQDLTWSGQEIFIYLNNSLDYSKNRLLIN